MVPSAAKVPLCFWLAYTTAKYRWQLKEATTLLQDAV